MITILHGTDEFRISERIKAVRASMIPEDLRDINTTFLSAHENDVEELFLTASVEYFPRLRHAELVLWIKEKAQMLGVDIQDSASASLASYIGPDLRVIDAEIMKLSLYKNFTNIEQADIENFVSNSRQQNIFKVVDACISRKLEEALRSSSALVQAGESPSGISRLIERQVKLLIRAKSLKESGMRGPEISKRLSLFGYPLQKTLEQENLISFRELRVMHDHILASEQRVRNGGMEEMSSLQTLIAEIGTILV